MSAPKVAMLAAGGSGGHLFPAFALAEELGRRGVIVDLVTDTRGDKFGSGFPARQIHQVASATIKGKAPHEVAKTVWALSRGLAAAVKLMREVRPNVVIGFGGYPTFPPLMAARLSNIPTIIHEQNAVLGRANRMLAGRVDAIAASFVVTKFIDEAMQKKTTLTGNPVREVVLQASQQPYWAPISGARINLLVFGGSQGARFFSDVVPPALALLPDGLRSRLNVVQQAREEDLDRVKAAYRESGIVADIATFFQNLPGLMSESHLVIARAGASTIAELTVIGRPSILVPLPHSIDNDQLENATRFAETGGALCIEQKDLTPEVLAEELYGLFSNPDILSEAHVRAKDQGRGDAVERLAELAEQLMANAKA